MKLLFPNPWGFARAAQSEIEKLRKEHGFSQAYADFLCGQNGVAFDKVKTDDKEYFAPSDADSDGNAEIRRLYGLDSGEKYCELRDAIKDWMFLPWFFPVGVDYGGNVFVEILHGKSRGFVASLDHEYFLGSSSLEEFLEDFKIEKFFEKSQDEQCDLLTSEKIGLAWMHATSFAEFTGSCLHINEDGFGFVVDAATVKEA